MPGWLAFLAALALGWAAAPIETTRARCDVGERPGYFVPGPEEGHLALLGCARLGVSGKRVEFSGNLDEIGKTRHSCINPAYGRGRYIPAICALRPPLSRFAVRDVARPRQGVRGYGLVIWGTAGASTHVVARFAGGTARATIIKVAPQLARNLGEPPFRLFVMELPLFAACAPITVTGNRSGAPQGVSPRSSRRSPCG